MKRPLAIGVCLALPLLSGCLVGSHESESYSGTTVSAPTFDQIEPGKTTKAWVLGTLGEPSSKTDIENGEELWKWSYTKTQKSNGYFLFVFGGSSEKSASGAAYVQIKDGLVTKKWRTDQ